MLAATTKKSLLQHLFNENMLVPGRQGSAFNSRLNQAMKAMARTYRWIFRALGADWQLLAGAEWDGPTLNAISPA